MTTNKTQSLDDVAAARVGALIPFYQAISQCPPEQTVARLLADIRHYCDSNRISWTRELGTGMLLHMREVHI